MNDNLNRPLAPYAIPHAGLLGRPIAETEDETRTPFQRDRDRIIHSQAFRRLQGKTQVFLAGEGDHYRSRLTHTMEVAQIARDLARRLKLNEDVAEAIALAHDLGHPPFGHRGEEALNAWIQTHGKHFEHNEQSLRIVTVLEMHATAIPGLNLSKEILEGLQKHTTQNRPGGRSLSLEAQVVNMADQIAYSAHDCDDGLRSGIFTMDDLETVSLAREAAKKATGRGTALRGAIIHLLTDDLSAETDRRLKAAGIRTLADVYRAKDEIVEFSPERTAQLKELRDFLFSRLYEHPRVMTANEEGQRIVQSLCETLHAHPTDKVRALQERTGSDLPDAVKDYVAGMTDAFAKAAAQGL